MSSMLSSQGLVLATAMAVSAGTVIVFDLLRDKYFSSIHFSMNQDPHPEKQLLKSCLSSGSKKEQKKKKKRVQFADDVKDSSGNSQVYRKEHRKYIGVVVQANSCGNEILELQGMPANHVALYSGILKNRGQRMAYSY